MFFITQRSRLRSFAICSLSIGAILLSGCNQSNTSKVDTKESVDPSQELKKQVAAQPIKNFEATPDDAHDIALLNDYGQRFDALTVELENELKQFKQDGNWTENLEFQRKRDLIESSLNMLKELDLKTQQGRYIQGLYYQYWENQANVYTELEQSEKDELKNPTDAIKNMSDYYTAQAQLKAWQQSTSSTVK